MKTVSTFGALLSAGILVGAVPTPSPGSNAANGSGEIPSRSPTSNVKGKAFDRFAVIYLENTDFDKAVGDPNIARLAKRGITLSNFNGLSHPSQPNYIGSIGGDYFGLDNDNPVNIPTDVACVMDLLDEKGISWGEYQEGIPRPGFTDDHYYNQQNGADMYERKHNPAVSYKSVTQSKERLGQIKGFDLFQEDLEKGTLPQWMFITPNMTNDGHDTSVTEAGAWSSRFLEPLLDDDRFMKNTLVVLTWDEAHNYVLRNNIAAILLGDAIPEELAGTEDDNFYTHYSELSTVEANWGLSTLGRWDVGANVFKFVAEKTGDELREWGLWPPFFTMLFNAPYYGPLGTILTGDWPAPNTKLVRNGRKILKSVRDRWAGKDGDTYYSDTVEIPDGIHPPDGDD